MCRHAGMAELADAHGSGPCESNFMRVQVPFPAVCGGVGIGRRARLRIWWRFTSCGFKSHSPQKEIRSGNVEKSMFPGFLMSGILFLSKQVRQIANVCFHAGGADHPLLQRMKLRRPVGKGTVLRKAGGACKQGGIGKTTGNGIRSMGVGTKCDQTSALFLKAF